MPSAARVPRSIPKASAAPSPRTAPAPRSACARRPARDAPAATSTTARASASPRAAPARTSAAPPPPRPTDCGTGQVCNAVGSGCGVCVPRCNWDFVNKTSAPECPAGQVCWVDHQNLDPSSRNFGAGRCRPPCSGDSQCTNTATNPQGGPKLVCESEDLGGSLSAPRCRPDGECMDDEECPVLPSTSLTDGYCNRATLRCETDCRVGIDPTTGGEYQDCRPGNKCEVQIDGRRVCKPKTCAELGGAAVACRPGQYCCGEDLNGDGIIEPVPASTDPVSQCYDMPKPPFCTTCASDADCAGLPNPSSSPLRSLCLNAPPAPEARTPVLSSATRRRSTSPASMRRAAPPPTVRCRSAFRASRTRTATSATRAASARRTWTRRFRKASRSPGSACAR